MSIRIDPEFKSLIPPLSPDEYKQLEDNCVAEGIRDLIGGNHMTKPKIIQYLREMLEISQQDNDEFFEEHKQKYPDTEWNYDYINSIKLGIIEMKIEFILMFLETEVKEEKKHGKQADDLRQIAGDVEADEDRI